MPGLVPVKPLRSCSVTEGGPGTQLSFRDNRQGIRKWRFDLALALLGGAIDHGGGMLLPSSVTASGGEVAAVVRDMLADCLIEEVRVADMMQAWRM